jgi:hypothetical protein
MRESYRKIRPDADFIFVSFFFIKKLNATEKEILIRR